MAPVGDDGHAGGDVVGNERVQYWARGVWDDPRPTAAIPIGLGDLDCDRDQRLLALRPAA